MTRLAVVPCSASKLSEPAAARDLYRGSLTRSALLAADQLNATGHVDGVVVLSAGHGLVDAHSWLRPYDITWGHALALTTTDLAAQLVRRVRAAGPLELLPLLPGRYASQLAAAAELVDGIELLANPLAGSRGLLEQRRRLRELRETAARQLDELEQATT